MVVDIPRIGCQGGADAQLQVRIGPTKDLGREHTLIRAAPKEARTND